MTTSVAYGLRLVLHLPLERATSVYDTHHTSTMKRILTLALASVLSLSTLAQAEKGAPLWLRHQQISPDGSRIAFCYRGDIYTVPTSGGTAFRLTSNAAYDGTPIWSPDSKQIAFSSDREGSKDVYIISADGSGLRRLTYNSEKELPVAFLDDNTLLFQSYIIPSIKDGMFPWDWFVQTYTLDLKKSVARPKLYSTYPTLDPSLRGGQMLYTDVKGYEDVWRKHAVSPVTRDIWLRDKDGKHTKLTSFGGEDRNAVWDRQGGFYYLSERGGSFNVFHRSSATATAQDEQVTSFTRNPVRFLSIASNGMLCYGYDGEIYTQTPGAAPQKVAISITRDDEEPQLVRKTLRDNISDFAVAKSNKEVAFVANGDVFVTATDYTTTRRITDTPEEERNIDISPDGRKLVYAAERNGGWNVYMTELTRKDDPLFTYARDHKETQLTKNKEASFQPLFSPDGTKVAYLRDRTGIFVHDLKTGRDYQVLDKKYNYSYIDGDFSYTWSPDGKWILCQYLGHGGWNHVDCALVKADGSGEVINLTQSGYTEGSPKFAFDGKAVLFASDRAGYRSHGSWGSERDYYLMFLDREAYEDFKLSKEDRELRKELKAVTDKKDEAKPAKKTTKGRKAKAEKSKPAEDKTFKPDFSDLDARTVRLTRASGSLSDAVINEDGSKLYYIARYESSYDLWEKDLLTQATKIISSDVGGGGIVLGKDGKTIYVGTNNGLNKLDGGTLKPITFAAEFNHRPAAERAYILDHAYQLVKEKFYDVNLHGVDWVYYRDTYKKFLPHIDNDEDFGELLSEFLGELNASHTGARVYPSRYAQQTGYFGAYYDQSHKGDGLKIEEILAGGPLTHFGDKIHAGMVIEKVDGETISADKPVELYLNGKVGKRTSVSFYDPKTGKRFEEFIRPISQSTQKELFFRRWEKQREELVEKLSGGRVAYVVVRAMNSYSYREAYKKLLGKYRNYDAVIVDTRYNGGGWLHEDLAFLLSGKLYQRFTPRGQYIGDDPFMQWTKPSCVLVSEGNYSNGHGFPWVYKHLGIGKVIGTPVAGTMTAVWWESQINPYIVFGVPQTTCSDLDGNAMENRTLQPDIEVYNTPANYESGHDAQLVRAVEEMMKTIGPKAKK